MQRRLGVHRLDRYWQIASNLADAAAVVQLERRDGAQSGFTLLNRLAELLALAPRSTWTVSMSNTFLGEEDPHAPEGSGLSGSHRTSFTSILRCGRL